MDADGESGNIGKNSSDRSGPSRIANGFGERPGSSSEAPPNSQGQLPSISLPTGGGALRGIDEKLSVNAASGSVALSVPVFTSPGRQGFGPDISLNYDSGSGNGIFGLGWSLSILSITRKTAKGLPRYHDHNDSDTFILSGAEDLVPFLDKKGARQKYDRGDYEMERFRPRTEGLFARIERWVHNDGGVHWRSVSKENTTSIYGFSKEYHVNDPDNKAHVFQWLLEETFDARGNVIRYEYKKENEQNIASGQVFEHGRKAGANGYIKRIFYGNEKPAVGNQPPLLGEQKKPWKPYERKDWLFQIVFDYGEHGTMATFSTPWNADPSIITDDVTVSPKEDTPWGSRPDPHSRYVAGFEQRTHRLCRRVLMFHCMKVDEHGDEPCLVRSTDFNYDKNEVATKLLGVTQTGYVRHKDDLFYRQRSLPANEYNYSKAEISSPPLDFDRKSLRNLPQGVDGGTYRWIDLDGEGIPGVLTEQGDTWYYSPNLGKGKFGAMRPVDPVPSLASLAASAQLVDLGGDGKQDCVSLGRGAGGYYERTDDGRWRSFRSFTSIPNIDWQDPNLRLIDLTGDGLADVLLSEHDVFVFYQFKEKRATPRASTSGTNSMKRRARLSCLPIPLSRFSWQICPVTGSLISPIRNGEVCYWPNLGDKYLEGLSGKT